MAWRLGFGEGTVERWLGRHFQDSLELNSQVCTEASYSCFGVPASNMQESLVFLLRTPNYGPDNSSYGTYYSDTNASRQN